jgi:tetratricopeptide (TPR) repeat protein
MSEALAQRADTLRVDVPREVWRRGKRPGRGMFIRAMSASTLALTGLAMPTLQMQVALLAIAAIVFAMLPVLTDSRLASIENEVQWADRSQATKLLETLEQRRLVALFAPFAWVQLQKGRLHLRLGDGRGAARAFAEAARLCGQPEQPALLGAQAHGLTLSGDRKEAHALLRTLEQRDALTPYDRLNLGIVLIEEGRAKQAAEHLEGAAEVLDQHPRALAAFALALAKAERVDEAAEVFERAEAIEDLDEDALAPDLLKRARKALRGAEPKSPRRSAEAAPAKTKAKKGTEKRRKKDRRKERRERRKGKADKDEALETRGSEPEPEPRKQREATEREKVEREKAEAAEKAEREKAEKVEREKAEREKVEREKAEKAEKVEREKAEREKVEREKAEREKAEREKAEREKAPAVLFEGDKPVFRPPTIPPPPTLKGKPGPVAAPKISVPAAPSKPAAPTPKPAADTGWDDVFGDDDAEPVVPVKKDD